MNKAMPMMIAATVMFMLYPSAYAEEENNIENTATEAFVPSAERGKVFFDKICSHCHNASHETSPVGAPGLKGVLDRHDEAWLNQWIKSPETFAKRDETAKDLIESNKFGLAMPTIPAMQDKHNRADIIAFLKTLK